MKTIGLFIGLFLMCACSSVRVAYDYDTAVNFSTYRSYNFYPSIESGLNSLDNHRIMTITDSILRFRGWEKSDNPQLYINFYASENVTPSRNTIGIGYGSIGRNTSVGISGGFPVGGNEVQQHLMIDFIDIAQDALIWQAQIESNYKQKSGPEGKQKHYQKVLDKVFSGFPPQ